MLRYGYHRWQRATGVWDYDYTEPLPCFASACVTMNMWNQQGLSNPHPPAWFYVADPNLVKSEG